MLLESFYEWREGCISHPDSVFNAKEGLGVLYSVHFS